MSSKNSPVNDEPTSGVVYLLNVTTARKSIKKAQKRQKQYYDWKTKPPQFRVGDRAFLLKQAECTGDARKLTRHYHGPYRVVKVTANNAKIRPVDVPQEEPILVSLERLRRCPKELGDEFWPARKPKKKNVIHKRSKVIRGRMM